MTIGKNEFYRARRKLDAYRVNCNSLARVQKNLVGNIAASHRLDEMHHLRLRKVLAAWKRINGFKMNEVLVERQRKIQEHVSSVDDPGYSEIETCCEPRR